MASPTGLPDVLRKQDLADFEEHLDQRFDMLRFEIRADFAGMRRGIIQWNLAALITSLAVCTLTARLS